jgi:hypothetical protein
MSANFAPVRVAEVMASNNDTTPLVVGATCSPMPLLVPQRTISTMTPQHYNVGGWHDVKILAAMCHCLVCTQA